MTCPSRPLRSAGQMPAESHGIHEEKRGLGGWRPLDPRNNPAAAAKSLPLPGAVGEAAHRVVPEALEMRALVGMAVFADRGGRRFHEAGLHRGIADVVRGGAVARLALDAG